LLDYVQYDDVSPPVRNSGFNHAGNASDYIRTCKTVVLVVEGSNQLIVNSLQPGNANQHWRYNKQRRTFDNGANPNKVLDVSGESKKQGAAVCAWDCHGKENQRWKIEPRSDRTHR